MSVVVVAAAAVAAAEMGNQYSDASGGNLVNHGQEGAGGVPPPSAPGDGAGFQPSHEPSVPLPVGGGGGRAGSQMREPGPLIGTPDELDSVPLDFAPQSAPHDVGRMTGTVHTRTHSFDAGDLSALDPIRPATLCRPSRFTVVVAAQVQAPSTSLRG